MADTSPLELMIAAQRDLREDLGWLRRDNQATRDALGQHMLETQRLFGEMREMRAGLGNYQQLRDDVHSLNENSKRATTGRASFVSAGVSLGIAGLVAGIRALTGNHS